MDSRFPLKQVVANLELANCGDPASGTQPCGISFRGRILEAGEPAKFPVNKS